MMLSASRGIGETAPVLLVIGSTYVADWNPRTSQTTLTTLMYSTIDSIWTYQRSEVWAIALLLIVVVFVLNLSSRIVVARLNRGNR
jgi:phosphate transport system permease protein